MSIINQKEYLKKYLKIGKGSGEKKKKKKAKPKQTSNGLKIVDDDIDVKLNQEIQVDLTADNEEAPQIVSVIDDRPPSLRIDEATQNKLWQPIGAPANEDKPLKFEGTMKFSRSTDNVKKGSELSQKIRRPRQDLSPSSFGRPIKKEVDSNDDGDADVSPPRKGRSVDSSPPRKIKREKSEDISPPRRRKTSDIDCSPPRRGRRHSDDFSPPRKSRNDDMSPLRKPKRRNNDDISPPRKSKTTKSDDNSPPRRRTQSANNSPQRKARRHDTDSSPPRTIRRHEADSSKKKDTSKKSRWGTPEVEVKTEKTLDGKKAGLQNATDLAHEMYKLKKREDELFRNMRPDVSGANAATVVRGKKKEVNWEEEEARRKKEKENKEKYDRWGKGLKQVEDMNEKMQNELYEMSKPLARYADDKDLEKYLKEQERDGDPMLAYLRKKKKKKAVEEGKPVIQQYEGDAPPNRFGIRPGYRWDGVDRSSGYEQQWFQVQNSRVASVEESYKWSIEDM